MRKLVLAVLLALIIAIPVSAAPGKRRVADKKFWLAVAAMYASSLFAAEGTRHCVNRSQGDQDRCTGYGPWKVREYGVRIGLTTALAVGTYYLKKADEENGDFRRTWHFIPLGWSTSQFVAGARSFSRNPLAGAHEEYEHQRQARACPSGTRCN